MKELFETIGLAPAEAQVLEILYNRGICTSTSIVKETQLSPSNVYAALNKLTQKALVTKIIINEKPRYKGTIEELKKVITEQMEEENNKKLSALIEIEKMTTLPQDTEEINDTEIFIGIENFRKAHAHLFSGPKQELLFFYKYTQENGETVQTFFSKMDVQNYYKNIATRAIFNKEYIPFYEKRKYAKFEKKFTDTPIPSSVNIYGNKVLILSWTGKPVAYLIHSKEIAQNFKELFEEIWVK